MEHWSVRLQRWMDDAGIKVPELSDRSGVSKESLYKYLRGRTAAPRGKTISQLAQVFGRTAAELEYGVVSQNLTPTEKIPLLTMDQLQSKSLLAGKLRDWRGEAVGVPSSVVSGDTFAVQISDDACIPTIAAGDRVIVDGQAPLQPGCFVVAFVAKLGHGVCRRYRPVDALNPTRYRLIATNEDYPPIDVHDISDAEILGRAVQVLKNI